MPIHADQPEVTIAIVEDRYSGAFSRGAWLAIRDPAAPVELGLSRLDWVEEYGPGGNDVEAAVFWYREKPDWIASGATPEAAKARLLRE
jgi:hypothetical protein